MPPPAVQDAMNASFPPSGTRRAVITESEGTRQATINVAEATSSRRSCEPRAIGRPLLRAQGFSEALQTIFKAAHGIDQKTMTSSTWTRSSRWAPDRSHTP